MVNNPNEIRIGPITRARAKLIEQQVNSLLIDSDVLFVEDFILPKSLYVCMIRYHEEDKAQGGEVQVSRRRRAEGLRTSATFRTSDIAGLRTSDTSRTSDIDGEDDARAFTETLQRRR